jgi:hypothetical protein
MPSPLFEFFEVVAEDLCVEDSRVITREDLAARDDSAPLLDDLKREMKAASSDEAIRLAVEILDRHFAERGSRTPFAYDPDTGRFTASDHVFLAFIVAMNEIRGLRERAKDFECEVTRLLSEKASGSLHRVGFPRERMRTRAQFNAHLRTLGFGRDVALGHEKDGGFDILWVLPLGAVPHQPLVSVQCKNGSFNIDNAYASVGAASASLSQHSGLQPAVHVPCVLFNDYISRESLTPKQLNFVPLGLTDLCSRMERVTLQMI